MPHLPLSGTWELRFEGLPGWQPLPVPGCWETLELPKQLPGPAWYRTRFVVPADWAGRRLWLEFGAVSYDCSVLVNGQQCGSHRGMWDAFRVEITGAARPGEPAELLVRVEKPASLTAGPDSPAVPGRFPLRETLAGFLPYVWGHSFGGIWQDVTLLATGQVLFGDVHVSTSYAGRVEVLAELSAPAEVQLSILDPGGTVVFEARQPGTTQARFRTLLPDPQPWSPARPALYEARLRLADGDERRIRFGLRSLSASGSRLLLNERPIYPRMVLSWGWYPEALHSNPGPARVRADLLRLQQLGYNGVKLCLWFPPQYYFDLADELGMLLWVELPMWLPRPTPAFREQVPLEYERLVRQARNHPSVMLYTLGCELNAEVDAALLEPLYTRLKQLVSPALVRDNSGSGEAYGGLLNEFADFYDHHFYGEIHFFRSLLDSFSPRWRPEQPWLFGEFCDLDTFRDLRRLGSTAQERPWWTQNDQQRNPQGARWQYDIIAQEARLRENGFWERGDELVRISEQQALFHRKATLELVRSYREISGYVITGEIDTPISTAGMWDELGRMKFEPQQFRAFNQDLVALVGWDRRRAWVAGGDRPAFWDRSSYPAGAAVRAHLIAAHDGAALGPAQASWSVALDGEAPFAGGELTSPFSLAPASVRALGVAEFQAPAVERPRPGTLQVRLQVGVEQAENSWPLWFFPAHPWEGLEELALLDPLGRLAELAGMLPGLRSELADARAAVASAWTPELAAYVEQGGAAVLLQAGPGPAGPLPTVALPFWREAVRVVEPHPAWQDFPHGGWAGPLFYGCATDYALDPASAGDALRPILRRLDARTMAVHDYAAELLRGQGRLIISTLRFEGGHGDQPSGLGRNTAAAYLLSCWLRYLCQR